MLPPADESHISIQGCAFLLQISFFLKQALFMTDLVVPVSKSAEILFLLIIVLRSAVCHPYEFGSFLGDIVASNLSLL